MTRQTEQKRWLDEPTDFYCIRADFADGTTSYTTVELAADRLDFIDRDKGIADLLDGLTFRSHMGTTYRRVDR